MAAAKPAQQEVTQAEVQAAADANPEVQVDAEGRRYIQVTLDNGTVRTDYVA